MEDQTIIDLFFARSEQALSETQQKYGTYCTAIAQRILQNHEESEECVSDAYLKLWQEIPPERPNSLRAFLSKIVQNSAISRYRNAHAEKRTADRCAKPFEELENCIAGSSDELVDKIVVTELINRFLEKLKRSDRIIFVRRYWYFYSISEIAAMEDTNVAVIKMSLYRSRNRLRKLLEQEGVFHG